MNVLTLILVPHGMQDCILCGQAFDKKTVITICMNLKGLNYHTVLSAALCF